MGTTSIANAQHLEKDDWNSISFSLALLQTLLAIVALGGYWLIKSAAVSAAQEEAEKCSKRCSEEWMQKNMGVLLNEYMSEGPGQLALIEAMIKAGFTVNLADDVTAEPDYDELFEGENDE